MLETVVVDEEGLVMRHMMCCTAVLDPYAVYFSNTTIGCCFAVAVCETTEYCVVGGSSAIISIGICQIRCLRIIIFLPPTASTTSSPGTATTPFILGLNRRPA